jgi:hypothetical protein
LRRYSNINDAVDYVPDHYKDSDTIHTQTIDNLRGDDGYDQLALRNAGEAAPAYANATSLSNTTHAYGAPPIVGE